MFKKSIPVRRVIAAKSSLTLLVLLLVVAQKLDAVTLENLYQAEVLSESQSDAQRRIDASEGLSQVLSVYRVARIFFRTRLLLPR